MDEFTPTLSPYSKSFEAFLDPRIKRLVLALVDKSYMPCYSCDGHKLYKPRYVIIAFGSLESREKFSNSIFNQWNRFFYSTEKLETLAIEQLEGRIYVHQSSDEEIRGLNLLFLKNYQRYWFLKINIGLTIYNYEDNETSLTANLKLKLRQFLVGTFNFFIREGLTSNLITRIRKLDLYLA